MQNTVLHGSQEADVHTNEAGSNVGYHGIICLRPPIHVTLLGGDIVEAQLSQLVPIDEWYWLLGDEDGEPVEPARRLLTVVWFSVWSSRILWKCDLC